MHGGNKRHVAVLLLDWELTNQETKGRKTSIIRRNTTKVQPSLIALPRSTTAKAITPKVRNMLRLRSSTRSRLISTLNKRIQRVSNKSN